LQECRWLRYKSIFDRIPPARERKAALESEIQAMSWNESEPVRPLNIKPKGGRDAGDRAFHPS
jgi:hypothetical protein